MKFEIKQCIENIKTLIKRNGLKIGDIEKKAGLSTGYLSKVLKNEKQENIPISTLEKIAELLNVSVDTLMYFDCSAFDEDEKIAIDFIETLRQKTINKELSWEKVIDRTTDKLSIPSNSIDIFTKFLSYPETLIYRFETQYGNKKLILAVNKTETGFKTDYLINNPLDDNKKLLFTDGKGSKNLKNKSEQLFLLVKDLSNFFCLPQENKEEMLNFNKKL